MSNSIYLHLGCGEKKFSGFVNIDLEAAGADLHLDLTQPLPWGQGMVSGIYSEHFFEHLTQAQGIRLLLECRRVLKPGGVVRIAMPDLKSVIDDYINDYVHPDWAHFGMPWTANRCERFNMSMRWWGHQWLYDEEELIRIGKMVGLEPIGRCKYGVSADPMFNNLEYRESSRLIVEFYKPERQLKSGDTLLVSIVIPAYNPRYFQVALESALSQTYGNLEILVTDDCKSDGIKEIISRYSSDERIRYMRNPDAGKDTGRYNHKLCFSEAKGEFIKFLNDDDALAPHCVERMLTSFLNYSDIILVTSKRQIIDQNGNFLPDCIATVAPVANDSVIDGLAIGAALLKTRINFIGEPSTIMFRKSEILDAIPDFMSIDGQEISWISDVAIHMNLAPKGNIVYLVEPLSFFRIHDGQIQQTGANISQIESPKAWGLIQYSWERRGLMKN